MSTSDQSWQSKAQSAVIGWVRVMCFRGGGGGGGWVAELSALPGLEEGGVCSHQGEE